MVDFAVVVDVAVVVVVVIVVVVIVFIVAAVGSLEDACCVLTCNWCECQS